MSWLCIVCLAAVSASESPVAAAAWQDGLLYAEFEEGVPVNEVMELIVSPQTHLAGGELVGARWRQRAADISDARWDEMMQRTRSQFRHSASNARQSVLIRPTCSRTVEAAVDALRRCGLVRRASRFPQIFFPSHVPGYQNLQTYENQRLTGGVGAEKGWAELSVYGHGGAVCDIEGDFNQDHCDLPEVQIIGPDPDQFGDDPNHATAVLGEVVSLDDGVGTTGIAPDASAAFATLYNDFGWDLGEAILNATDALPAGSILILEIHIPGPNYQNDGTQFGLVPGEWYEPWFDDIQTAVANGMVVVEAGGNGSQDLDSQDYQQGNGGHWPFMPGNDSGAIIVGAGGAWNSCYGSTWRSRLSFSNWGSRVDVQGWGECVVTTGYGYLWNQTDCTYTNVFGGTSSASPIVAGAAALVQSWVQDYRGANLSSVAMRSLLTATGNPQTNGQYPASQHIGPLPDAYEAIQSYDDFFVVQVPEDYPTIADAIAASAGGEQIIVGPGTYVGPLDFDGRTLTLTSTEGPEATTIDAAQQGTTVTLMSHESPTIDGFTVTGGHAVLGSAFRINGNPAIKNCIIRDNIATTNYCILSSGDPVISNTMFCQNTPNNVAVSWVDGGGNSFEDVCPGNEPCDGDVTGDGIVDVNDILQAVSGFGTEYGVDDILLILKNFGAPC